MLSAFYSKRAGRGIGNYTYDDAGNVLSVADTISSQSGGVNSYTYDALNRMSQVTQSGNGVADKRVDMTYNQLGQFSSINRYADLNGTQLVAGSTYSYDALTRLTNLTHRNSTTGVAFYNLVYDPASRITQVTDIDGENNYTYDDRNQLVGANHASAANPDESYIYDTNGNRVTSSLHSNGYQIGANNRLLSDGTYNYEYDDEGNRTKRTEIATGEVTEYAWDYRNRLTSVVTKDTTSNVIKQVEYTYDVFDRRIAKEVDPDGAGAATAEVERMVYDGDNIALTFDGNGTQTHRYLYGSGVDQIIADENASSEVLWALTDNQGTVRDLVDSTGTIQNHISYDSYGQVTNETNPAIDTRFGYTGREFDEETGQYYYRSRYYDPAAGRFISEDPIGFDAGDVNLYRYVGNNPTNRIDPTGEDWYDVLNRVDQAVAGFADTVSFGTTTRVREALYGETATRNHSGGLFRAGQAAGVVASTAVGFGAASNAARGGGWAIRAAQGYTA